MESKGFGELGYEIEFVDGCVCSSVVEDPRQQPRKLKPKPCKPFQSEASKIIFLRPQEILNFNYPAIVINFALAKLHPMISKDVGEGAIWVGGVTNNLKASMLHLLEDQRDLLARWSKST